MASLYNWVKIFHVMFVVAWMAGLLYLARIFVYHSDPDISSDTSEVFKVMERRLYFFIAYPSAVIVWITGIYMAHALGLYPWLIVKFIFVILLTVYHLNLGTYLNNFNENLNTKSSRFYRLINEIPFLIMFIILCLVIIKPEINF